MEEVKQLRRSIRAADDAFFYSMRTLDDLIERDETLERLQTQLGKLLRKERMQRRAIAERRLRR
jgi:hypothetical protein